MAPPNPLTSKEGNKRGDANSIALMTIQLHSVSGLHER